MVSTDVIIANLSAILPSEPVPSKKAGGSATHVHVGDRNYGGVRAPIYFIGCSKVNSQRADNLINTNRPKPGEVSHHMRAWREV
jgi:hypothetical protein